MWDKNKVTIEFIQYTDQMIHFSVSNGNGEFQIWGTIIYAHNTLDKRRRLWEDINKIAQNVRWP